MRGDPTREQRPLIRLRESLLQRLQPHLVHKRLRHRPPQHALSARRILKQITRLQLRLQPIQRRAQRVARLRPARKGTPRMRAPDARELVPGVFGDFGLDIFDVGGVEGCGGAGVFADHECEVFGVGETESGEDFEGGRGYAACDSFF